MRNVTSLVLLGALVVACGGGGTRDLSSFDTPDPNAGNGGNGDGSGNGNGGGPSFGDTSSNSLAIVPKNTTVIIDTTTNPPTAGTATFKVMQGTQDLTAGATFTIDDATLGKFAGATFTSLGSLPPGQLGKSSQIQAHVASGGTALGTLTVVQLHKTGKQRDFFFVVPYNDNPTPPSDVLTFSTTIKQADVAFVMDTTGSMSGSIDNLKTALAGSLLAQLQAAIPNVGLAVVDHKDFNSGDPWAINVRQSVTTTLSLAQNAVNAMSASGGGDEPEAQIGAMLYALNGQANNGSPSIGAAPAVAGTFGGVHFRSGSVPVVVEITDASWHDPSGSATMAALQSAFTSNQAKFVNITDASYGPENQANQLSDATNSNVPASAFKPGAGCGAGQCCTGVNGASRPATGPGGSCRLNFLHQSGNGVSSGIVQAIEAISVGTKFDVKAVPSNDPSNAKGVDATKFIKALRAMDEGSQPNGCPAATAQDTDGDGIKDTFIGVTSGTPVCFEVIANKNTIVPPDAGPQFFNAFVDVIGVQGNLKLDHRSVLFMVPPKDPSVN